jgi:hypothetical protein
VPPAAITNDPGYCIRFCSKNIPTQGNRCTGFNHAEEMPGLPMTTTSDVYVFDNTKTGGGRPAARHPARWSASPADEERRQIVGRAHSPETGARHGLVNVRAVVSHASGVSEPTHQGEP